MGCHVTSKNDGSYDIFRVNYAYALSGTNFQFSLPGPGKSEEFRINEFLVLMGSFEMTCFEAAEGHPITMGDIAESKLAG